MPSGGLARGLAGALTIATVLSACGGGEGGIVNASPDPVIITLSPTALTLNVGANGLISVAVSGGSTSVPPTLAMCASAVAAIATAVVQGSGCSVTGVTPGSTIITATTSTGVQASAEITVTPLPSALTDLTVTPVVAVVLVGETRALSSSVVAGGTGVTVSYTYTSSNLGVATVSSEGVVTGVSADTATITVRATGTGQGFTPVVLTAAASITVIVLGTGFADAQFAPIPAGSYLRGSADGGGEERPQRTITIAAFRMQKTEVTQGQWRQVMLGLANENPSFNTPCGDLCPVEQVSWDEVQQFLSRLNVQDPGKGYRLPTEAEWEYATRAGTTGEYNVAGQSVEALGWINTNSNGSTRRVAQKMPNAFGLYDTHGNIFEWVNDWWDANYYATSSSANPQGPSSGTDKVIRGGAWFYDAYVARSAFRGQGSPSGHSGLYGFRLAKSP